MQLPPLARKTQQHGEVEIVRPPLAQRYLLRAGRVGGTSLRYSTNVLVQVALQVTGDGSDGDDGCGGRATGDGW